MILNLKQPNICLHARGEKHLGGDEINLVCVRWAPASGSFIGSVRDIAVRSSPFPSGHRPKPHKAPLARLFSSPTARTSSLSGSRGCPWPDMGAVEDVTFAKVPPVPDRLIVQCLLAARARCCLLPRHRAERSCLSRRAPSTAGTSRGTSMTLTNSAVTAEGMNCSTGVNTGKILSVSSLHVQ